MGTRISSLEAAGPLTGVERLVLSVPDLVGVVATDISVDATDGSYNSTTTDFVTEGFTVGRGVGVAGCANAANNLQQPSGVITAVTANKLTVSLPAGYSLTNEAAGASVTITQWASRQLDLNTLRADSVAQVTDSVGASAFAKQSFVVAASGEAEALTTGTSKVVFRMPYAFTVIGVRASLTTAQTSGAAVTIDINKSSVSILSTLLTFDNTERTTTTATTAAVLSATTIADDEEVAIDIDQIGDGTAAGLKVTLIGYPATAAESLVIPVTDEVTAITAGTNKITMRMPYGFVLTGIRASLSTAQTSGATFTVDVNEGGTSILSTKLTFDNTERTTTTATTLPVLSDTVLADDAEITVDVDQIGDGTAKGLKIAFIGYRSV